MQKSLVLALTFLFSASALNAALGSASNKPKTVGNVPGGQIVPWLEHEIAAGFPLRKSIDLNHLPTKYLKNACEADMMVGMLRTGLGSKMKNVMNQFALASYGGFSFALGGQTYFMAEWKKYFNQTVPICENAGKKGSVPVSEHEALNFNEEFKKVDPAHFTDFRRAVFQKFYKLADQAQHDVTEMLKEIGYPDDNQVIAVHIRRGDKSKELKNMDVAPTPNEKYGDKIINAVKIEEVEEQQAYYVATARKIKNIIEGHGTKIKKVFIGSDDGSVRNAMAKILGETYEIVGFQSQEWKGSKNSEKMYGNDDYIYGVLADIEAFRRSAFFIGTGSSGTSHLAYFLRDGNQKSESLDMDWLEHLD